MLDKDLIKKSLNKYDIIKLMEYLGSPLRKEESESLVFETVCHNSIGEGSAKLYYYIDSHTFYCYTECGSMDVYSVVMQAKAQQNQPISFYEALQIVVSITGKAFRRTENNSNIDKKYIIDDWDFLRKYQHHKQIRKEDIELKAYDESVLSRFVYKPHISWIEEGISWQSQRKFGIGYDIDSDKIVIPHRDIRGRLVGIRGRALDPDDLERGQKYMPMFIYGRSFAHSLGANVYGLYENRQAINTIHKIIIFEGEKSVIKCQDYFGEDNFAVAVCGSHITTVQRDMILKTGVKEVFIAMDKEYEVHGDEESIEYAKQIKRWGDMFAPYCRTYIVWDKQDYLQRQDSPADRGKDTLVQLMKEKIEITTIDTVVQIKEDE